MNQKAIPYPGAETSPPPTVPLLQLTDLAVSFPDRDAGDELRVVNGISLNLEKGKTLGLVGESGCGKSMTALALLRLVPRPGRITSGTIMFDGIDLRQLADTDMESLRGNRIAMIFQEPMTCLNPVLSIKTQLTEPLLQHQHMTMSDAEEKVLGLLRRVRIPDPEKKLEQYPHHLSGGMRQRSRHF